MRNSLIFSNFAEVNILLVMVKSDKSEEIKALKKALSQEKRKNKTLEKKYSEEKLKSKLLVEKPRAFDPRGQSGVDP